MKGKVRIIVKNKMELQAMDVCRLVVQFAEGAQLCGICGEGDAHGMAPGIAVEEHEHKPGCPYPKAKEVMEAEL